MTDKTQKRKALALYREGHSLKDIGAQLGMPDATVRSWKARDKWDDPNAILQQKVQRVATHKSPVSVADKAMIDDVESNPELNDKLRAFCLHYARTYNGTAAAIRAGYTASRAARTAYELLQLHCVHAEIKRLKQLRHTALLAGAEDVVEKYMQIAFADLSDFIEWGRTESDVMGPLGPIQIKHETSGELFALKKTINEVRFIESANVDGTLLSEIRQGKNGVSVKLADRMRALEWLSKYFEINPADRHRREYDCKRLELEVFKAERDVPAPEQSTPDDGFLVAIESQAADMWPDEFSGDDPQAPNANEEVP